MSQVPVTVEPATFTLVDYSASDIGDLVSEVAGWLGLTESDPVRVEIDESSPLAVSKLTSLDPIVIWLEGGAIEHLKRIRTLDPQGVQVVAMRLLARVADRRRPGFGDPPGEDELTVEQLDCWDAWTLGRATRFGLDVGQQRWRYRFRNRHGFTDAADRVFDRLWEATDVTWADIEAACAETAAARPEVA